MKRILRRLNRFRFVWASVLVLLLPHMAEAATVERPVRAERSPAGPEMAFAIPIPQPLALDPALIRIGTPVQDCRDFSNLDRAIQACTRVNASKNSGEADAVYCPEQSLQRVPAQGHDR